MQCEGDFSEEALDPKATMEILWPIEWEAGKARIYFRGLLINFQDYMLKVCGMFRLLFQF